MLHTCPCFPLVHLHSVGWHVVPWKRLKIRSHKPSSSAEVPKSALTIIEVNIKSTEKIMLLRPKQVSNAYRSKFKDLDAPWNSGSSKQFIISIKFYAGTNKKKIKPWLTWIKHTHTHTQQWRMDFNADTNVRHQFSYTLSHIGSLHRWSWVCNKQCRLLPVLWA